MKSTYAILLTALLSTGGYAALRTVAPPSVTHRAPPASTGCPPAAATQPPPASSSHIPSAHVPKGDDKPPALPRNPDEKLIPEEPMKTLPPQTQPPPPPCG
jgi:hypothetical protein